MRGNTNQLAKRSGQPSACGGDVSSYENLGQQRAYLLRGRYRNVQDWAVDVCGEEGVLRLSIRSDTSDAPDETRALELRSFTVHVRV